MANGIVIVGENMMMRPKWLIFFNKSFSWTMLKNSKKYYYGMYVTPPTPSIVVNNIIYYFVENWGLKINYY
jgi:hypothetical protein